MALALFGTLYHHHAAEPILPIARTSIYSLRAIHIFALGLRGAAVDATGGTCSPHERAAWLSVTNTEEVSHAHRHYGHLVMGTKITNIDGSTSTTAKTRYARDDIDNRLNTMTYNTWVQGRPKRQEAAAKAAAHAAAVRERERALRAAAANTRGAPPAGSTHGLPPQTPVGLPRAQSNVLNTQAAALASRPASGFNGTGI